MSEKARLLREKALAELAKRKKEITEPIDTDIHKLIEELSIFQIELEQQNDELVNTQLELEHINNKFKTLFDKAPVGYVLLNDKGIINEVNKYFLDLVAKNRSQVLNTPFYTYVVPDSQDEYYLFSRQLVNKQKELQLEIMLHNEANQKIWAHISATNQEFSASEEPLYLLAISNISLQKKMQMQLAEEREKLVQSERKFRQIVEGSSDIFFYFDLEKKKLEYISPKVKELFGYNDNEIIEWTVEQMLERIQPNYRQKLLELYKLNNTELKQFQLEIGAVTKNEEPKYIKIQFKPDEDIPGKINRIIGCIQDLTLIKSQENDIQEAQKLTEKQQELLKDSEYRYRKMFEVMNTGVAVYEPIEHGQDFRILEFNTAAEKITRIKKEAVFGKTLLQEFPNMDKTPFVQALRQCYLSGKNIYIEPFFYKDNTREGWRENHIYKLPSGEIVALFTDVTEKKKAEIMLKKQNDELLSTIEKLQESEEKFQELAENISDVFWLRTNEQMLYINKAFEQVFGVPR